MNRRSIKDRGGLEAHMERLSIPYAMFKHMAEANWDAEAKQYNGISSMARILGVTDATIIKWLRVYDEEIGRTRA